MPKQPKFQIGDTVKCVSRRLIHYSDKPVSRVRSTPLSRQEVSYKPHGFWLSVEGENDWKEWCEGEQFRAIEEQLAYEIELAPSANILKISSVREIDSFHSVYSSKISSRRENIDWRRVAENYDGIIIAPYIWERRLVGDASGWYYPWDCASGCIWNNGAVAKVKQFTTPATSNLSREGSDELCLGRKGILG